MMIFKDKGDQTPVVTCETMQNANDSEHGGMIGAENRKSRLQTWMGCVVIPLRGSCPLRVRILGLKAAAILSHSTRIDLLPRSSSARVALKKVDEIS